MPARHRAPEPSRSPLLIVFILIILAGLICGGILLWQKLSPAGPDAASSPPASSGAGNSQPPQQAQQAVPVKLLKEGLHYFTIFPVR